MIIKGTLEGTDKLKFEMKIYTRIYIKLIMKNDLLNRTGGSTEQTVITYMRKKTEKKYTSMCN